MRMTPEKAMRIYETYWKVAGVMNWVVFALTAAYTAVVVRGEGGTLHADAWVLLVTLPLGFVLNLLPARRFVEWAALRLHGRITMGLGVRRARI